MIGKRWITRLFSVFIPAVLVSGCSFGTFISGGGAMRVQVDVYKGPLSKEPAIQVGELVAVLHELERSLSMFDESLLLAREIHEDDHGADNKPPPMDMAKSGRQEVATAGVSDASRLVASGKTDDGGSEPVRPWDAVLDFNNAQFNKGEWCEGATEFEDSAWTLYRRVPCLVAAQIHYDVHGLRKHLSLLTGRLKPEGENLWVKQANCVISGYGNACQNKQEQGRGGMVIALQDIAWLSGRLQIKAQYWTQAHVALNPADRLTRGRIVSFVNLLSQYSGQLTNRADVLLKQLDIKDTAGFDRRKSAGFPLSVYLRDTELSDTLGLFVWNRAAAYPTIPDLLYHPVESLSAEGTANRVRVAERVFDDQNWHRINEVFASGRGDVNMVLVKDDIGNWTLKSFDSDPADLLAAYTSVGKTALRALAEKTSPDMGAAKKILNSVVAPGKNTAETATETDEMIAKLRSYYIYELKELQLKVTADNMSGEDQKQKTEEILRRYRSALVDIRRLSLAGKLPGSASDSGPEKK